MTNADTAAMSLGLIRGGNYDFAGTGIYRSYGIIFTRSVFRIGLSYAERLSFDTSMESPVNAGIGVSVRVCVFCKSSFLEAMSWPWEL